MKTRKSYRRAGKRRGKHEEKAEKDAAWEAGCGDGGQPGTGSGGPERQPSDVDRSYAGHSGEIDGGRMHENRSDITPHLGRQGGEH